MLDHLRQKLIKSVFLIKTMSMEFDEKNVSFELRTEGFFHWKFNNLASNCADITFVSSEMKTDTG